LGGNRPRLLCSGPAWWAWNDYEIEVVSDTYTVSLNGQQTTVSTNNDSYRGKSPSQDARSGFIGLQAHRVRVA